MRLSNSHRSALTLGHTFLLIVYHPYSVGYRPLTRFLQSLQLPPCVLDRPLFLFPWGFHLRDCLGILVAGLCKVWLIHLQGRCWISASTGFCFVRCHSSSLLILSSHRMRRICLRQLMMNVWILLVIVMVVLHVSAPYKRTDFTMVLKSLILC